VNASPVIADGKIYFGDFANNFYSLDLETRLQANSGSDIAPATEWQADVEGWVWASALVDGDNVYVGTLGGRVFGFNRSNGTEIWNEPAKIDGQVIASPAIVQSGSVRTLAVPSSDKDVHLVTLVDGANTGRRYSTNGAVMAEPLFISEAETNLSYVIVHSQNGELYRFAPSSLNQIDCFKTEDGGRCN
jgi:outer membrane protein assembly factor BamB